MRMLCLMLCMLCGVYGLDEVFGHVEPRMQDLLLLDIQHSTLMEIGRNLDVDYLGPASKDCRFPVTGLVHHPNHRLMVNLICTRKNTTVNVVFLIDTGSPTTYLSHQAMEVLAGDNIPKTLMVLIQDFTVVQCHLSPRDADVNVLGMDFFASRRLSIQINYNTKEVHLIE